MIYQPTPDELAHMRKTPRCPRCGAARFRFDGKKDWPVCGWCAAKELLAGPPFLRSRILAAGEFVRAHAQAEIVEQLLLTDADAERLFRITGAQPHAA